MYEAGPARPFRFLYFSAEGTPRDPTQRPAFKGDYQVMRVSTPYFCKPLYLRYRRDIGCFCGVLTLSLVRNRAHGSQISRGI